MVVYRAFCHEVDHSGRVSRAREERQQRRLPRATEERQHRATEEVTWPPLQSATEEAVESDRGEATVGRTTYSTSEERAVEGDGGGCVPA